MPHAALHSVLGNGSDAQTREKAMARFTNLKRIDFTGTFRPIDKLCWCREADNSVWMSCDQGHWAGLGNNHHHIAPNGDVSPSIVCAYEGCTFHVWGKLLSWP